MSEIGDLLKRSLLTFGLTDEQTEAIAALGHKENFSAGEHLAMNGAHEADLFVLFDGHINVLTDDRDKLYEVGAAGILGEISFVDGGPRDANFIAEGYVAAARFPAKELRAHLCSDRQVGFTVLANLSRLLASRLRTAEGRLDTLMDHDHDIWEHAQ